MGYESRKRWNNSAPFSSGESNTLLDIMLLYNGFTTGGTNNAFGYGAWSKYQEHVAMSLSVIILDALTTVTTMSHGVSALTERWRENIV